MNPAHLHQEPTPRRRKPTWMRYGLIALATFLITRLTFVFSDNPEMRPLLSPGYWQALFRTGSAMRIIQSFYVSPEKVDYNTLSTDAIRSMVDPLDRHSTYFDSDQMRTFSIHTQQQYVGVGIEIEKIDGRITIKRVFPDSPASQAGFSPGDQIVGVADENTEEASTSEVSELLRGLENTEERVTLYRPATQQTVKLRVKRQHIEYSSVVDERFLSQEAGIAYLRLTQFGQYSFRELKEALDRLSAEGMQGLILDLRNNPGGYLFAAIDIADLFLAPDLLIVSTQGRSDSANSESPSKNEPTFPHLPLVILLNEQSASASEIVAGALQDHHRAIIIGAPSVGKGSVQQVFPLSDSEAIKLTTAMYFLPSGRTIHERGIQPDIQVTPSEADRLQLIFQRSYLSLMTDDEFERRFGFAPIPDPQIEAALGVLQGMKAYHTQ